MHIRRCLQLVLNQTTAYLVCLGCYLARLKKHRIETVIEEGNCGRFGAEQTLELLRKYVDPRDP